MPAMVTVNDFRWQFIAGDKYWLIGAVRLSGAYVTGGVDVSFEDTRDRFPFPSSPPAPFNINTMLPDGAGTVKATRQPWFAIFMPGPNGEQFSFRTKSAQLGQDPPNTVGTAGREDQVAMNNNENLAGNAVPTDINDGKLMIFSGTGQLAAGTQLSSFPPVVGLFIFQGME
jgi:hypothetical protein